jgi:membrane protease YdiL (CAAX protease family)
LLLPLIAAAFFARAPLAPTPRAPRLSRAWLILLLYGALAAAALAWGALAGRPNIYRLNRAYPAENLLLGPIYGAALGLAVVFATRVAVHRFEWARVLHREFHALVHELSTREIVLLAAASSIGEELFFRGALLPVVDVWPQAILFAVLHVRPQLRFLPWTIMSLIFGLVMGKMFLAFGDLGGPIATHFTINLLNLSYIARHELKA